VGGLRCLREGRCSVCDFSRPYAGEEGSEIAVEVPLCREQRIADAESAVCGAAGASNNGTTRSGMKRVWE
jgi:hypothetical protein